MEALIFHFICPSGTYAEHLYQLLNIRCSESTLSERRQALTWTLFTNLLRLFLRPLSSLKRNPDAFYHGLRLLAVDGTCFSLTNTPRILSKIKKSASRRSLAAWAKINVAALIELGIHNPLAAEIGINNESEHALARRLWEMIPKHSLLLADRLYGTPAMLCDIIDHCAKVGSHFLIRTMCSHQVHVIKTLSDGSHIVHVPLNDKEKPRKVVRWLKLREINVLVKHPSGRTENVRLWTSLLDHLTYPAMELAELYVKRWEHELYWRQMKLELRKSEILQSHTLETAAQEIVAIIIGTALIAKERVNAATGKTCVLDISFLKCLDLIRPFWQLCRLISKIMPPSKIDLLYKLLLKDIRGLRKQKKRARSCPRAVRRPVSGWPRLLQTKYSKGSASISISEKLPPITERH